jgi:hypothetical protein
VEVVIILLFSWRLAWHLCMWRASEYDGAYVSGEESKRAVIRTVMATLFFSALGCAARYEFLHG